MTQPVNSEGDYGVCRNCNTEVKGATKKSSCPECGITDLKIVRNIGGVRKLKGRVIR